MTVNAPIADMTTRESSTARLKRACATGTGRLILLALVSAAITIMYRPFSQPEGGDAAIYDYIAQSILRGQVPYRDVADIKGPFAPQLSAAAMAIGSVIGIRDIIAVRSLHVVLVCLLSVLTFLVAEVYLRSRAAGLIAVLIPLMFSTYLEMMVGGTQPKLPMMIFGMLSLIMIAKDRPFWAGFSSMLSCLCWQPGLLFAGVAFLIFSGYLSSWRDLRAIKVLAGAILPLAVTLAYFYWRGALEEMWAWTITYNYSVFGPAAKKSFADASQHLWRITQRVFQIDVVMLGISTLGLLIFLVERLRVKGRGSLRAPDLFRDAIALAPLIYLGFCFINIQSGPDLIPLVPFIGIFGGWMFVQAGRTAARSGYAQKAASRPRLEAVVSGAAMGVILLVSLYRGAAYRIEGWTLGAQYRAMESLSTLLAPDDRIYVHGAVEILTLLNRPNLNPYVFLDWGADEFAAVRRNTSFSSLIEEMEAQAPKLVSITRLGKVRHRAELEKWVEDHYQQMTPGYEGIYMRRSDDMTTRIASVLTGH
ncbi:MAG TPA: DolP-mannose mannosyltransferase [Blastocatellia bacterium]|nr:DolP-mannose mannosyltransferase [Blastocatellia bacterium]